MSQSPRLPDAKRPMTELATNVLHYGDNLDISFATSWSLGSCGSVSSTSCSALWGETCRAQATNCDDSYTSIHSPSWNQSPRVPTSLRAWVMPLSSASGVVTVRRQPCGLTGSKVSPKNAHRRCR